MEISNFCIFLKKHTKQTFESQIVDIKYIPHNSSKNHLEGNFQYVSSFVTGDDNGELKMSKAVDEAIYQNERQNTVIDKNESCVWK